MSVPLDLSVRPLATNYMTLYVCINVDMHTGTSCIISCMLALYGGGCSYLRLQLPADLVYTIRR